MTLDVEQPRSSWWRRRNWWKIGFFVMLALFEIAREVAVIASNQPPNIATFASVGGTMGFTSAKGRWKRIDGGTKLLPSATTIQCQQAKGECVESNVSFYNGAINEPDISTYGARFSADAISYENNDPLCARYSVRIDLKLKKVFAVRERKPLNSEQPQCKDLEQRIEMSLGNGFQKDENLLAGHFVPLLSTIVWMVDKT
jgi:hypothetical protein